MSAFVFITQKLINRGFDSHPDPNFPEHLKGRYTYGQTDWHFGKIRHFLVEGLSRKEDAIAFFHAYLIRNEGGNTRAEKEYIKDIFNHDVWLALKSSNQNMSIIKLNVENFYRVE